MSSSKRVLTKTSVSDACDWLNGYWDSDPPGFATPESRQRVIELVSLLKAAESVVSWKPASSSQSAAVLPALNDKLKAYKLCYRAFPKADGTWHLAEGLDLDSDENEDFIEAVAVIQLVHAFQRGAISQFRNCNCGRWFFAQNRIQQSCSAKCRHKRYERKVEFKAHRVRYMRRYYEQRTDEMLLWAADAHKRWRPNRHGDRFAWIVAKVNDSIYALDEQWRPITRVWVRRYDQQIQALANAAVPTSKRT